MISIDEEINFCPFCDAPGHKIVGFKDLSLCKGCDRFFKLNPVKLKCLKCSSERIIHSDFPSPNGGLILQCKSCKKMFPAGELIVKNEY